MHLLVTLWLLDFKTQWPHQSWTCLICLICSLPTNSLNQYYSSKCTQISRPESSLFPSLFESTATPQPDFHHTVLFRLNTTCDIAEAKHIATALCSALCKSSMQICQIIAFAEKSWSTAADDFKNKDKALTLIFTFTLVINILLPSLMFELIISLVSQCGAHNLGFHILNVKTPWADGGSTLCSISRPAW